MHSSQNAKFVFFGKYKLLISVQGFWECDAVSTNE